MTGPWIHIRTSTKLLDRPEALEFGRVYNPDAKRMKFYWAPYGIIYNLVMTRKDYVYYSKNKKIHKSL